MIWHSSEYEEVLRSLEVDPQKGLANGVADLRLEKNGKNIISNIEKPSFAKHLLSQLKNKYVYLLTVIALFSFVLSIIYEEANAYSSLLIIAIVALNAVISAYHLFNCECNLNKLKGISIPAATVIRDGVEQQINSSDLVTGDIIILKEGDYISADARLIETNNFRCDESVISGLSVPVSKAADQIIEDITPLKERVNMVYSGCNVVHGTAKAVVVETGLNTEIGRTSTIFQQSGKDTLPLENALSNIGKYANISILVICILVFIINLIINFRSGGHFASITAKILIDSVALGIAALPEGLPAISTIVIALGIQRAVKDGIIIKKTSALETLNNTTVICSDKTGVLTRNKMFLNFIFDGENVTEFENETDTQVSERAANVLKLAAACSTLNNDSTEKTIEKACLKYNSMSKIDIENIFPRLCTIPFDTDRKIMTSINMINGKPVAIIKGAPENVIEKCTGCNKDIVSRLNEEMTSLALRVICIAVKQLDEIPANPNPDEIEYDLTFVGLIGLNDPPRPETISAIEECFSAGIKTVMITGDNLNTAKSIARRIGILKDGDEAITGLELNELSDEELKESIHKYTVFARVSPDDKLRIVNAFQSVGETVTITGDSVSDAAALSKADIGCSMGKLGTDVAKGNSDIVIENNNFSSIVNVIRESRGLFDNIRKCVSYLLSCNLGEILAYVFGILIFKAPPLAAVQLLWINLLTDSTPVLSLTEEKAESDIMTYKPSYFNRRIINKKLLINTVIESVFIALSTLIAFLIGNKTDISNAMTMAFAVLGITQIIHLYNIKSRCSVIKMDFKSNKLMNLSSILVLFIMCFLVLTPAGYLFGLTILSAGNFFAALGLSLIIIPVCEILKIVNK